MGNNDQPANGSDRFADDRGVIQDLLAGPIDCVTEICTLKGKVRGNHFHSETIQWTYVVSGLLRVRHGKPGEGYVQGDYGPGAMIHDEPGTAHAWKAMKDTVVLVFTRGPRSGADYESDVTRLTGKDRLITG